MQVHMGLMASPPKMGAFMEDFGNCVQSCHGAKAGVLCIVHNISQNNFETQPQKELLENNGGALQLCMIESPTPKSPYDTMWFCIFYFHR